jgi:hypothetical protein
MPVARPRRSSPTDVTLIVVTVSAFFSVSRIRRLAHLVAVVRAGEWHSSHLRGFHQLVRLQDDRPGVARIIAARTTVPAAFMRRATPPRRDGLSTHFTFAWAGLMRDNSGHIGVWHT